MFHVQNVYDNLINYLIKKQAVVNLVINIANIKIKSG